jgi:hypothetical protein
MPVKRLPSHPSLVHLRHQSKDLLRGHAARRPDVAQQLREFHPRFARSTDAEIFSAKIKLSDAQLTVARQSGFASWTRLKTHIENPGLPDRLQLPHQERIADPAFRRAVELLDAGDAPGLRDHLAHHPQLAHQRVLFAGENYFVNPTLLEFVAENPVRHGALPPNIIEVATVILHAGVAESALNDTLTLVATGRVARESHLQIPLINLLCAHGAHPASAIQAAAAHGEWEAVSALIARGAPVNLPVAAALGRVADFRRLLPAADSRDRHLALSFAAQFGHLEIVRFLLDAGEDPNRYNPVGAHSHSTPLHQAAGAGHIELVRLLVARGARLDLRDILWQGTPADWATHAVHTQIAACLHAHSARQK